MNNPITTITLTRASREEQQSLFHTRHAPRAHHASLDLGDHPDKMGLWGMMSGGARTDLLGWDKYLSGFFSDNQVRCVSPSITSTHYLTPSVTKGTAENLQGALVYTVDLTQTEHGERIESQARAPTERDTPDVEKIISRQKRRSKAIYNRN